MANKLKKLILTGVKIRKHHGMSIIVMEKTILNLVVKQGKLKIIHQEF